MNPAQFFSGDGDGGNSSRPSPRKQLQGPRPTALKVSKDSHKIRKPPTAPNPHHQPLSQSTAPPRAADERQPVIIYAVSPKVILTTVGDFMDLVQSLTGNITEDSAASSADDLSPAARLASIQKTSPRTVEIAMNSKNDIIGDLLGDIEIGGRFSGILSPAPASLPPISSGFFSPVAGDLFMMGLNTMFVPSPSTFYSAPMVSPSPSSSYDFLFNSIFDF